MTTKEMAEVMLAYDRGEQIQCKSEIYYCFDNDPEWEDINDEPIWDWNNYSYRVKPKEKIVPFETVEEFIEAQRKHGVEVKMKECEILYYSYVNKDNNVVLVDFSDMSCTETSLKNIFEECVFEDGTPCGKEVEQ